jgi:hypothetical protein
VMGLLSRIPIVSMGNCAICLWVWGSAILGVFLYRTFEKQNPSLTVGQGALLGLVAGVFGAIIASLFSLLNLAGMASVMESVQSLPGNESIPPAILDLMVSPASSIISTLLCAGPFYLAFGALGGVIATALIWKPKATPPPAMQ